MKLRNVFIAWLIVMTATVFGASDRATSQTGRLEPFGLQGKIVTSLGRYGALYAGTDSAGVFRRSLDGPDSAWVLLGLEGKTIRSVYPHKYGPIGFAVSVGVEPHYAAGDSTLVYCSVFDQPTWTPTDSGIDRRAVGWVKSLDGFPDPTICGETFAAGGAQIYRRRFASRYWEKVFDIGIGVVNVVKVHLERGIVWAGGENAIFAPWIVRSSDKGDNWQMFFPNLGGDNACNSLAIHPTHPDTVYAGMEGAVIQTTDGGKNWKITGLRDTPVYFYGLAIDPFNPEHIYAGGSPAGNTWALWESFDGGATWQQVPEVWAMPPKGISSIVADPARPGVIYIATLGDGVWRYQSDVTGVRDWPSGTIPEAYRLEQNYPNPFNAGTVISYQLSVISNQKTQRVTLKVYDVRGREVRTLVDEPQSAGIHRIGWDGRDEGGGELPSGVYFYRLQVGDAIVAMRKAVLVR